MCVGSYWCDEPVSTLERRHQTVTSRLALPPFRHHNPVVVVAGDCIPMASYQ